MQDTALSLAMLMVFALPIGALVLWRRGGARKQAVLMLVLAAVLAANIAFLVVPNDKGVAPVSRTPD